MSLEREKSPTQPQFVQEHQQAPSSEENVYVSSHKSKNILLIVIILLLLGVVGVGAYYLGKTEFNIEFSRRKPDQTENKPELKDDCLTPTQGLEPTVAPISGELKRLDRDLALFKVLNPSDSMIESHVYYEAGELSGEWEGYTRIVAIKSQDGPGLPETFILATKDFQEYVLNDSTNKTVNYQETDWESPLYSLDQEKVVKTAVFDSSLPEVINLNDQFVLYYSGLLTQYQETNKRDQYGNTIAEYHLKTDLSDFQSLSSPVSHLKMFFEPAHIDQSYIDEMPPETQSIMRSKANYILGDTNVIVLDSIGVPAIYSLTTPDAIKLTKQAEVSHGQKRLQYQEALKKYEAGEISDYPQYPEAPGIPDLGFDRNEIITESGNSFFDTYQKAFPSACALGTPGTVVKVQDGDLEQIGTVFKLPLFRLKAEQHDLNKLAYHNKMDSYQGSSEIFDLSNPGLPYPSFEDYVEKTPLMFVKDYWGRWVALGEYQIILPIVCGKPVIYLYPTQPTEVTVKLLSQTRFTVDVPKYNSERGWKVLAQPNGDLIDLQPELTDCSQLDSARFGMEYVDKACQSLKYPYLYWAGTVADRKYPQPEKGWIVEKRELENFFLEKLSAMGFLDSEIAQFVEYWLPQMKSHQESFFRISFLQTEELNQLFPLEVQPTPQSILRIFLDYQPLQKQPTFAPIPQTLKRVQRSGFALVEWGGLKR